MRAVMLPIDPSVTSASPPSMRSSDSSGVNASAEDMHRIGSESEAASSRFGQWLRDASRTRAASTNEYEATSTAS